MDHQHIQKQIGKADKIYMQDSTPGFKSFEYVQGYKQGVREMRKLLIEALSTVWEEARKEIEDGIKKWKYNSVHRSIQCAEEREKVINDIFEALKQSQDKDEGR